MMTDTIRPLVVGIMQTPPYDRMFKQSRRVYFAKGISPTLHTQGVFRLQVSFGRIEQQGVLGYHYHHALAQHRIERMGSEKQL